MKTAWFLGHRIREAMRTGDLAPMGGAGGIVEIDETYIGRKEGFEVQRGGGHKNAVLTLVERGGAARSFHVESVQERRRYADRPRQSGPRKPRHDRRGRPLCQARRRVRRHDAVDHGRGEYGYTDRKTGAKINTNTVEGYYSIFKRGMIGIYQHCGEQHLHRYLAEFDFRYSNASSSASMTPPAPNARCKASKASG